MNIDPSQEHNRSSSRLSKEFTKAALAGFIIIFGCTLAGAFRTFFMIEPTNFFTRFITFLVVPVVIIYLVATVSDEILIRYGFEGLWVPSKNDNAGLRFTKITGLILGAFVGFFFLVFSGVLIWNVWKFLKASYGENIEDFVGLLFIAGIVVFLLYRFRSFRQENSLKSKRRANNSL